MSKNFFLIALLTLMPALAGAGETTQYGEALTEGLEPTPIETILEDPQSWVGKKVQIAGEISGVCARQGCWIDITSPQDSTLRVKVDDGVIVFPQDSVGRRAIAEGEVEILDMDRDQYEAWLRHVADEEGREFDAAEVGEGPYEIVRLKGLGSEIEGP
jgi:hypothetical protein